MGKEDTVYIKVKYISLLRIKITKKNYILPSETKKPKVIQTFSYLKKISLGICHKFLFNI